MRYVDGESTDEVEEIPLYREEYLLLTRLDGPFGRCDRVAWSQLADLPLCLFTSNLQHRRIVDSALRRAGVSASPSIETDSILALTTHVRTGNWVSVVSSLIVNAIDLSGSLRVVPRDSDHPVNRGTLCPKGAAAIDYIRSETRVQYPMHRKPGTDKFERVSWTASRGS